jgi:hypothetical protein
LRTRRFPRLGTTGGSTFGAPGQGAGVVLQCRILRKVTWMLPPAAVMEQQNSIVASDCKPTHLVGFSLFVQTALHAGITLHRSICHAAAEYPRKAPSR